MKIKKFSVIALWTLIALSIIAMCILTESQDKISYLDRFFIGMSSLMLASGCAITYIVYE